LLVVIAIIGILVSLLLPAIQSAREAARRSQCTSNLKNLALGIHSFHDARKHFPAAITFPKSDPPKYYDPTVDSKLFGNWAIDVLPYVEETALHDQFVIQVDPDITLRHSENYVPRGTEIGIMLCPSDAGKGNLFQGSASSTGADGNWARGNYGYNAIQIWPDSTVWKSFYEGSAVGDRQPLLAYNLGMGGFDNGFYRQVLNAARISDGMSKTIMFGELRVGLSPRDRRGVWAMGMCGSNMHCRHAAFGPNDCGGFNDDVYRYNEIVEDVPRDTLLSECMAPDPNVAASGQTVVRSVHAGGANCALADGSVRFISDFVDAGSALRQLSAFIGQKDGQTSDDALRTWQRLLISRDGLPIEGEF
jgi:prepilin-type processing-associated H-X9-DG protein